MFTVLALFTIMLMVGMATLPTVKIKADKSFPGRKFVTIIEADFDPKIHKRYDPDAKSESPPKTTPPEKPPSSSETDVSGSAAAIIAEYNAAHQDAPIDPSQIEGTGAGGKITKPDAEKAIAEREEAE